MPKEPIRLPEVPMGSSIPRILHQHFLSGEAAIPPAIRDIQKALRCRNPGWTYSFWDSARAETFIAGTYGPAVLERYLRIRPEYHAARSDLLRYLALYVEGGVYLDVKSTCLRPLDDAIRPEDRFLLMEWGVVGHEELAGVPEGEFVQWAIVTVPGHPFLREAILRVLRNIDDYAEWRSGVGRKGTLRVTGPIAYTLAIAPVRALHPHTHLRRPEERDFVYSMLPDMLSHRDLFGTKAHYSGLDSPVVATSPSRRILAGAVRVARRIPPAVWVARKIRPLIGGPPT